MQETLNKEHISPEIQARILSNYERKTRLLRWIFMGIMITLLISVWIAIFLASRPLPATIQTLRHIEELEKNIVKQRAQIDSDRKDVKLAREQALKMQQQILLQQQLIFRIDSLRKAEKDTFYYLK